VFCGVGAVEFWEMDLTEINAVMRAYRRRREKQIKDDMFLAWNIGKFAAVGVNAPKKYLKWASIEADLDKGFKNVAPVKSVRQSDEEMERVCRMMAFRGRRSKR